MPSPDATSMVSALQARFERHPHRHASVSWAQVLAALEANPAARAALAAMEATGGEPDVTGHDPATGRIVVCDCAPESPAGRCSLCFDRAAWVSRKANRPRGSALEMAAEMGVEMLSEAHYHQLQALGEFDLKTSSWVATPADVRSRGGALFCDRRYGKVFTYHNGAESYYAARGFRARLLL